jgi:hypothetical protein
MGKITIPFAISVTTTVASNVEGNDGKGIPAYELVQLLNSIPGETYITSIHQENIVDMRIPFVIEAENDLFPDGTSIEGLWTRDISIENDRFRQFIVFQGIDIRRPEKL